MMPTPHMVQHSRAAKVLILSSGQALTALVSIGSAAALARVFTQTDYASYRQTLLAYAFAVPFITLGFDRALYYFIPREQHRARGVLVENLLCLLTGGLLLSLFLAWGGTGVLASRFSNPGLTHLLILLVPYPLFMLPASSLAACLMTRDRTEQVAGFLVGSRLIMLLVIVIPCLMWPTPETAIIGTVVGAATTSVVALTMMFRSCTTGAAWPTWKGIRSQIQFSVPLGAATLVGTVTKTLDQVMVAASAAPTTFAIYVNGAMEIPLIGMVTGSTTSVLLADYARLFRENRLADIRALIHRAMVKTAVPLFAAMVFLMCMAPELMCIVFGARYADSAIPFRLYLLMLPARTITFSAVLQATGHSRKILIQALISLTMNALLLWYAIRLFGPLNAPIGPVLSLYVFAVPYLIFSLTRVLQCSASSLFPWFELLRVAAVSCMGLPVMAGLKYFGGEWPPVVLVGVAAAAYGAITLAGLLAIGRSDVLPWQIGFRAARRR